MMIKALLEAKAVGISEVFLTVDARNQPAWEMYRALGFEPFDRREVFLALL
jgi:ribosomal protein S18 acetylase RimI-like enzyme